MDRGPDDLDELLQRAYRYALALTHDASSAEDLVQEACVSIARRGGPWQVGYLFSAVRSRFIDGCRRRGLVAFESIEHADVAAAESVDALLDDTLERALAKLKPADRELLMLAVVEEYSTKEIADLTGRPLGTVLSSIHRAKLKLREWLSPLQRIL